MSDRLRLVTDDQVDRWRILAAQVDARGRVDASFVVLLVASTAATAYGLLAGSVVVVLSAMLLAPFPGQCLGIAFGLSTRDQGLCRRAAISGAEMIVVTVAVGTLAGLLARPFEIGTLLLAQGWPDWRAVLVALAAGFATAFSLVDQRIDATLPGAAVSVVLIPPLVTLGLSLAAGRLEWAGGALLGFGANLLAVESAAVATFSWLGRRSA